MAFPSDLIRVIITSSTSVN